MNETGTNIRQERQGYYASTQGPFQQVSSVLMFFAGAGRGQVLDSLERSIAEGSTLLSVNGEPGSGKTLMSLVLAERLRYRHNLIRYEHTGLTQPALLRHLLIELCPEHASEFFHRDANVKLADAELADAELESALEPLCAALEAPAPADKPYLLVIDSDAPVTPATHAMLQRLCQVQCLVSPALQVVLFQRCDAPPARSRPLVSAGFLPDHELRRLAPVEVDAYLQHQMMLFDFNRRDLFTPEMSCFVAERSAGLFRAINTLAHRAFRLAEQERALRLDLSHLIMADVPGHACDVMSTGFLARHGRCVIALTAAVIVGLTVLAYLIFI